MDTTTTAAATRPHSGSTEAQPVKTATTAAAKRAPSGVLREQDLLTRILLCADS